MESLSQVSKVVVFNHLGGPEVLEIVSLKVPAPAAGEVRIRVKAMGLNRADSMYRRGEYIEQPVFPARIGYEAAGFVDAIGAGIKNLAIGDAVSVIPAFSLNQYATHSQYALVPEYSVEKHDSTLDFEHAASLWSTYLTAYGLLIDTAQIKSGQSVLINAASSGVGLAAIQTANAVGAVSIALTTSSSKRKALLDAGAAYVIATKEQNVVDEILKITEDRGADVLLDAVGGEEFGTLLTAMAMKGKIYVYGSLSTNPISVRGLDIYMKGLSINGFTVYDVNIDPVRQQAAKDFIYAGLKTGQLNPIIAKIFAFDDIVEAHRFLESNQQVGKVVVTF